MRIIVKGADFSNVSIGKVIKDLSFNYNTLQLVNSVLTNPIDDLSVVDPVNGYGAGNGHNGSVTYYGAAEGDANYQSYTNKYRFISNLIEVAEGMVITYNMLTSMTPLFIFYSDKNTMIIPPQGYWGSDTGTFTIPSGVKYIRFQTSKIYTYTLVKGEMG